MLNHDNLCSTPTRKLQIRQRASTVNNPQHVYQDLAKSIKHENPEKFYETSESNDTTIPDSASCLNYQLERDKSLENLMRKDMAGAIRQSSSHQIKKSSHLIFSQKSSKSLLESPKLISEKRKKSRQASTTSTNSLIENSKNCIKCGKILSHKLVCQKNFTLDHTLKQEKSFSEISHTCDRLRSKSETKRIKPSRSCNSSRNFGVQSRSSASIGDFLGKIKSMRMRIIMLR